MVMADSMRFIIFNAVRELLFNVAKHAGVTRAEIEVKQTADRRFAVTVSDQGIGFNPQAGNCLEAGSGQIWSVYPAGTHCKSWWQCRHLQPPW